MLRAITQSRRFSAGLTRCMSSTVRPYIFHIGASWMGKPPSTDDLPKVSFPPDSGIGLWRDQTLSMSNSALRRDPGEDFFYVQEMRNVSGVSFGVADGVGGWVNSGVDPSLFSQALMYHAHRYSQNAWAGEPEIDPTLDYEQRQQVEGWELTPSECMDLAYNGVLRERFIEAGSSTACILTLNSSSGVLRAANLGDSGFLVIRSSSLFYKQSVQTHFFNCPLQLAKLPETVKNIDDLFHDSPSDAETFETKLRDGDIVIAYTDGLSDNVFPSEIISICSLVTSTKGSETERVQIIADRLVDYSRKSMMNRHRPTPFEDEASKQGRFHRGGKPDDVTVIVALVRETQ